MHLVTKQTNINDREVEKDIMDMMMEGQGGRKAVGIIAAGVKGELNTYDIHLNDDLRLLYFSREPGTRGCVARKGGNYKCKCKRGFAGRYCERGGYDLINN